MLETLPKLSVPNGKNPIDMKTISREDSFKRTLRGHTFPSLRDEDMVRSIWRHIANREWTFVARSLIDWTNLEHAKTIVK